MPTFLNINLDGKTQTRFLLKHILFSLFWILGILIFIFRMDTVIMKNYGATLQWLNVSIATIYICLLGLSFLFMKWYYIIVFFFYPVLMLFWFIPKTVLSIGKVYLFGSYLTSIYSVFSHIKLSIFNFLLIFFSTIFLLTIHLNWTIWLALIAASYLYIRYILKFFRNAFKLPVLFGDKIEKEIKRNLDNKLPEKSAIISSYVLRKNDEDLGLNERQEKQIKRAVLANYAIELLSSRLSGFRGRRAYLISWLFGTVMFFIFSLLFFWFVNFQLFKLNSHNFIYTGNTPVFDFFYYTFKTIVFSGADMVTPISILARTSQMCSFFIIGIVTLVIIASTMLSLKQDKMAENLKLTRELFRHENTILSKYMLTKLGVDIKDAVKELKNIEESRKNLKKIIDRLF